MGNCCEIETNLPLLSIPCVLDDLYSHFLGHIFLAIHMASKKGRGPRFGWRRVSPKHAHGLMVGKAEEQTSGALQFFYCYTPLLRRERKDWSPKYELETKS
jgi:hypothetical protein